jgi:hypothetical protein
LGDGVVEILAAAGAGVSVADSHGRRRFVTATTDTVTVLEEIQQDTEDGPCIRAWQTNEAVCVADLRERVEWPAVRQTAIRLGLLTVTGVPCHWAGRPSVR